MIPMKAKQKLYDLMLNRHRKDDDPRDAAIDTSDFGLRAEGLSEALDVCAICHGPRR
jgi:mono/diheme cytochrome c family protein